MSVSPEPIAPVPSETVRVAKAAFPKGNPYLTFRDVLGVIFGDADFAHLFSHTGQPAVPPWRLAIITLMQFRENLSDRQAAESVRSRIDWKYLLGLELTDAGFDHSVLCEFRSRLLSGKSEHLLLERLLEQCQTLGLIKTRGKQRTDSTRVISSIRQLNRLELVAETLRAALNELAIHYPEWLKLISPKEWYKRYGQRIEDYRLPETSAQRDTYAQQVGEDGYYLLDCLTQTNRTIHWQQLASIKALKIAWQRHYERNSESSIEGKRVHWKSNKELSRSPQAIESPYDLDARYRYRSGVSWTGYIVHFCETCEDKTPHLITHVMTTDATVHEAQCTNKIHQALIEKQLAPREHFVDSAYVDAQLLVLSQQQGIELVGPTRPNFSWQKRTEGAFDSTQFQINWSMKQVICPNGKSSALWKEYVDSQGHPYIRVRFKSKDCQTCPLRSQCTKAKVQGRSLGFLPQVEHEALKQAREAHASVEGQERYKRRAGIEGTISQGVRGFGLRRSRYRGLAKTHLQNIALAAAMNIDRLFNWLENVPRAKTRISRFAALVDS